MSLSDYMRQKSLTGRIKASPAAAASRLQMLNRIGNSLYHIGQQLEPEADSPPLPDSALAALRKASAMVDQAKQKESQQPKVDLQQGRGQTRKLE